MKYGLADLDGERRRFTATVGKFGKIPKTKVRSVMLKDVKLATTKDVVADHVWVRKDEFGSGPHPHKGVDISFVATVGQYVKGHSGMLGRIKPLTADYHLYDLDRVRTGMGLG